MIVAGLTSRFIHGETPGKYGQKFVVTRYETDSPRLQLFELYAVNLFSQEDPEHRLIVAGFKINPENVLGGGRVALEGNRVRLYGTSGAYGSVPLRFLNFFKQPILFDYRRTFPQISEILIDVPKESPNDKKATFLDELLQEQQR